MRRYLGDTFYGGGEWTLLTAWLGWQRVLAGDREGYQECRRWVAAAAVQPGNELPEQVTVAPQDARMVDPWVERWGPVATPLLWSHAMWILLTLAAEERRVELIPLRASRTRRASRSRSRWSGCDAPAALELRHLTSVVATACGRGGDDARDLPARSRPAATASTPCATA